MNVVYIINVHYPFGMAATMRVRLFAEFLENKNTKVNVIISNQSNGNNQRFGENNGVKFSTLLNNKLPTFIYYLIYPFLVFYKLFISKQEKNSNVLIIYSGINLFNLQFIVIGKLLGYKIIIDAVEDHILSTENIPPLGQLNIRISDVLLPYLGFFIDGVVVISTRLMSKYRKLFKSHPIKIIPVSASNINLPLTSNIDIHKKIKMVYSGSYGHKDGIDFLINAFVEVSKNNSNLQLLLLGGPGQNIIDKVISTKNKNIEIFGYLPDNDYFKILGDADILCMTRVNSPYANAGFPFKLGEYLATRKSVIVTDVSDIKRYLTDKKDCVIAKPSDTASLINAMEYLVNNPDKRSKIGLNGYKKCEIFFNPEVNGKMLLKFLKQISP